MLVGVSRAAGRRSSWSGREREGDLCRQLDVRPRICLPLLSSVLTAYTLSLLSRILRYERRPSFALDINGDRSAWSHCTPTTAD